jgi:hypothetical protein
MKLCATLYFLREVSMKIIGRPHGPALRTTLLAAVAVGAMPLSAFARDLPPTPEGAEKLSAIFATYLGKPASGAPSPVSVTVEGAHYAVALDLAGLTAPLKQADFSMDAATLTWALTEQDDGTWHVTSDSLPPLSIRVKEDTIVYHFTGYKADGIFDPALTMFKSGQQSLDRLEAKVHGPKIDEAIVIGALHVKQTATPAANGATSIAAHEELADMSVDVSGTPDGAKEGDDSKPIQATIKLPAALADVNIDGAPLRKALDLWAFVAAHPSRPEIAADEATFKDLLRALLPADFKVFEKAEAKQVVVEAPQGPFGVAGARFRIGVSSAPGPRSALEYSIAMDGLTTPAGLLPPAMSDLTPTAVNLDLKAAGFDLNAGFEEAINDMHFAGDGPIIAEADRQQIFAKMKGTAPITIELSPSHVVAPQIDLTLEGVLHLEGARPTGILKVRIGNFDKTLAAIKALGPAATPQVLGGLALAKTLGKSETDGALTWVAEYGADGSMKVNGLPLGKAP